MAGAVPDGRTRAKVCGLTREDDVDAAVAAGADAVGFVVDVPVDTPREISAERAAELAARVPPFVSTVLVTFPDRAAALAEQVDVDAVQLHGEVSPGDLDTLRDATGVRVVKTVSADATDAAETARRYAAVADAIHLDSTDAAGGGGTGRTHDWAASAALVAELAVPVVLAGGLTPENVADAVAAVRPFAVDVASGVERAGGVKDHGAVAEFVQRAGAAGPGRSAATDPLGEGST